jgi:molybdopterin-guanine dinucleotide biosynthesis protein A
MPIEFLSFPVQSGKTTWLADTFSGRSDTFGFLTPGGPEDRRLHALPTGEERPYAAAEGVEAIEIGRFRLDVAAFEWGLAHVRKAIANPACKRLIIDEIGLLEVRQNRGFAPGIDAIINAVRHRNDLTTYLVVRDFLLTEARDRWQLHSATVNDPRLFPARPPCTGIVLAGGQSRRMGTDKAFIERDGTPAYARAATLLAPHCERVLVNGPAAYPPYASLPDASDLQGHGPMSGVRTAARIGGGLLVLGVDYPQLAAAAIERLMAAALLTGRSVCFRQASRAEADALEPLVAYYAPHDLAALAAWPGASLRRFLAERDPVVLPHDHRLGLVSVDLP